MQISLPTPARKLLFLSLFLLAVAFYIRACAMIWLADRAADPASPSGLDRAISLQPGNAEYRYLLGRYYLLAQQSPQLALPLFLKAVALNPHRADYWFGLATTYQLLGSTDSEQQALERAIRADPATPTVAWHAANFFLARGDVQRALDEFRVVLQSGSYRMPDSVRLCWQIEPDVAYLVQYTLPSKPDVYFVLLDYLVSIRENSPAAQLWTHLVQLNQPLEQRQVLEYVRYLISSRDIDQATLVWQQAANLAGLASYQPSPDNLIINGDFSLQVLNSGFGWHYEDIPGVQLALDPSESHTGHQSLSIAYDSSSLSDSGIWQQIPVQPNTRYDFSANFKAPDIQGAGGPQFLIADAFSGVQYFASDALKDADFWKQIDGTFATASDARLITLRIQRIPAGSPIRGRLWIDGLRLRPESGGPNRAEVSH